MSTIYPGILARRTGRRRTQPTITDIVRPIGVSVYVAIIAANLVSAHGSILVWALFVPVALLALASLVPLGRVPERARLVGFLVWAVTAAALFSINGGVFAEGFVFLAAAGAGQLLLSSRDAGIVALTAAALTALGIIVFHGGLYIGWPWWLGAGAGAGVYVGLARRLSVEKRADVAALLRETERADQAEAAEAAVLERNQVALDITDALSESLSSASIQLDLVDSFQAVATETAGADALRHARLLTRTGLAESRRAVDALKTQPRPLPVSLRALAQAHGATFELRGPAAELSVPTNQTLLRAVSEGLTDAHLFAPGAPVRIVLDLTDPTSVDLHIVNGISPDHRESTADSREASSLGLQGVKERARFLGGTVDYGPTLDDVANPGWTVTVRLPR